MPRYEYFCPENQQTVEVDHSMNEKLTTWGELCDRAKIDPGTTALDSPIKKQISAPNINIPLSNSKAKELGFTKLVRKEKGVYENVTATGDEKRYFKANDPSSYPKFKKKVKD